MGVGVVGSLVRLAGVVYVLARSHWALGGFVVLGRQGIGPVWGHHVGFD